MPREMSVQSSMPHIFILQELTGLVIANPNNSILCFSPLIAENFKLNLISFCNKNKSINTKLVSSMFWKERVQGKDSHLDCLFKLILDCWLCEIRCSVQTAEVFYAYPMSKSIEICSLSNGTIPWGLFLLPWRHWDLEDGFQTIYNTFEEYMGPILHFASLLSPYSR